MHGLRKPSPTTTPEKLYKRPETTRVLFPRFEYEADPIGLKVIDRAGLRVWLPTVELKPLLEPKVIVETTPQHNVRGGWYGVYHRAVGRLTLGRLIKSPFTDTTQLYRSRYIDHTFLWDEQAIDGRATEIVLEKLDLHKPKFDEVLAILTTPNNEYQRLVMKNESGKWTEPNFNHDYPERDFNLAVLRELAVRTNLGSTS